jgi:hypothetical protein
VCRVIAALTNTRGKKLEAELSEQYVLSTFETNDFLKHMQNSYQMGRVDRVVQSPKTGSPLAGRVGC